MSRFSRPEVQNILKLTLKFTNAVGARQDDKNENLVVSPYNALMCLAMVAKGTAGNTREEMAQTLFGVSAAELDKAAADLITLNQNILDRSNDSVTLKTANGIWVNSDAGKLEGQFADDMEQNFSAAIKEDSFANPAVVKEINQWASDNTNKLITDIIDEVGPDQFAIIASALYFKGDWTSKFDKALTEDRRFTMERFR